MYEVGRVPGTQIQVVAQDVVSRIQKRNVMESETQNGERAAAAVVQVQLAGRLGLVE